MNGSARLLGIGIFLCALVSAGLPARAAEPELIKTYASWSAYQFTEDGDKVCYMASQPGNTDGDYKKRGEVFALITNRPADGTKNVFSYIAGYSYKSGSKVSLKIDKTEFTLFTQDETAWAPDAQTDEKIAQALRHGSKMVITGTSERGTLTTDTFSLTGSGAAHDAIAKNCKVK